MAVSTSLNRLPARDWGPAQARHLLLRAGFGPSPAEITETTALGPESAVDRLVDYRQMDAGRLPEPDLDPDVIRPPTREERQAFRQARRGRREGADNPIRRRRMLARRDDRRMHVELQEWWLDRMIDTPRPLEEKLTLLWHGHFATRHRNVRDAYLMYRQNRLFRENAAGSFAELAGGIVRDPAMLKFLNNIQNVARKPNENLAREFMELFTLGEGNYSENDIKEGARALTGYHVDDNDFTFRRRAHDGRQKTILGKRGNFDGDDFVSILLKKKQCARFIAFKLYRHFVADVSDDESEWAPQTHRVIDDLADLLTRHRFELRPVLKTLLSSRHFYDPAITGRKVKSPAQLVVGTARSMQTPKRQGRVLRESMRMMGQQLFDPPSVAGWDGGRGWVNTSTLFVRQNLCTYLITGKNPARMKWSRGNVNYDPMALLADVDKTPDAVVNHLADALLGEHVPPARREPLVTFMRRRDKGVTADSVVALLLLTTAMPEYQLC